MVDEGVRKCFDDCSLMTGVQEGGIWGMGKTLCRKEEVSGAWVIQIKICAEYRDMLPRPRLICQEPGLRPIGRSPGEPDKSSRGLGSMSRYSAQILICFISYVFLHFFIPLWVWLGTLQDYQYAQCPLPLSIVIRMRLVIMSWGCWWLGTHDWRLAQYVVVTLWWSGDDGRALS